MHCKHDAHYIMVVVHAVCNEGTVYRVYSRWMVLHHRRVVYAILGFRVASLHVTKTLEQNSIVCSEFLSNSHYQEYPTLLQTEQIRESKGQFVLLNNAFSDWNNSAIRMQSAKVPNHTCTEYD